jgi:hypothetical protein
VTRWCNTFTRCELQLVRECGSIVAVCRDKITCLQCDDLFQMINQARAYPSVVRDLRTFNALGLENNL